MPIFNLQSQYRVLKESSSLKAFYDDIVYWEIASEHNRFYVTFMDGLYGIPNDRQESISTMEIGFPHTSPGNDSTGSFGNPNLVNRVNAEYDAFLVNDETGSGADTFPARHTFNGFIPITELRGTRYFQSTLTGSKFVQNTYDYELYDDATDTVTVQKTISASFFYPFTSHQLSVLREEPTIIIDLKKESELFNGIGEDGFILVPQDTNDKVKDNLEYYLEKAGLIEKTTRTKSPRRGR